MDAERDAVKFRVINRLNRRFRPYNISFQVIDLRIGINTQTLEKTEGENKVLEVCLSKIDQARPFFIGLLGNRYGWCPDDIRIETVLNRIGASVEKGACVGRSVTEIEIIHYLYKGDSAFLDSLFFIRSAKSYEGMPLSVLENIDDRYSSRKNSTDIEKLENLKQRLLNDSLRLKSDNIYTYDLTWNRLENRFDKIDDFVELVYNAMCRRVESELIEMSAHTQWYQIERDMVKAHFESSSLFSAPLSIPQLDNVKHNIVLSGASGSGKTVTISQIYNALKNNSTCFILAAAVGAGEESLTMERIIVRWILELSEKCGGAPLDANVLEHAGRNELKQTLARYCSDFISGGKQIVFMLDSVERFMSYNPDDMLNDWLPDGCLYIASADSSKAQEIASSFMAVRYDVDIFNDNITSGIIDYLQKYYAIELPAEMIADMKKNRLMPRHIVLIFKFLSNLSSTDYKYIRCIDRAGSEIEKINGYILDLYLKSPKSETERLNYYLEAFVSAMNMEKDILRAIGYIAVSHCGLSREQIADLLGYTPSMPDLELILNLASDYISEHPATHVIFFRHPAFAEEYLRTAGLDISVMASEVADLIGRIAEDELTDDLSLLKICTGVRGRNRNVVGGLLRYDVFSENGITDYYDFTLWGKAAYLINESQASWDGLKELVDTFSPSEAVRLLYLLHKKFPLKSIEKIAGLIENVMDCGLAELDLSSAYALAWMLISMAQYGKHGFMEGALRENYLKAAERIYAEILSDVQCYSDAFNMRLVALMELMEVYSGKGDNEGLFETMAKLEKTNSK